MASYPVTVYRWDDVGAPGLANGRASDIINIWQKCLVEGYGTKAPLGWSRPFYDTSNQRAVFRNDVSNGGSGGCAILYSNTNNDDDYNLMRLTHAKSMVDIDTPVGLGVIKGFQVINQSGDNRFTKWVLIGTAIGFYFIVSQNNKPMGGVAAYNPSMYVGDIFSSVPNDAGRFITDTGNVGATDTSSTSFVSSLDRCSTGSTGGVKIWGSDNSDISTNYNTIYSVGYMHEITAYTNSPETTQMFGPCYYAITQLGFVISNANVVNNVSPGFRGFLPGFYLGIRYYPADLVWPQIINHNDENFWLMRSTQGTPAAVVQLGEWHDPFV